MATTNLLILADWFYPGFKGGGPIRSTVNLALALQNQVNVRVLTSDTDFGEEVPYSYIAPNSWSDAFHSNIPVYYLSSDHVSLQHLRVLLNEAKPDVIYLNSMFSVPFTIWPLWLQWRGHYKGKIVLAPRGMLHKGALQYKKSKKQVFLRLIKLSGLHRHIHFHATDGQEAADIQRVFGSKAMVQVIPNLPSPVTQNVSPISKTAGVANLVFISRIQAKKNLLFLLQCLQQVSGLVTLNVYGSFENAAYQQQCKDLAATLPAGIVVLWHGPINHNEVLSVLSQNHFFVLPTFGENFGHAIFEAFAAGRPVLISDQTPWKALQQSGIGYNVPLNQPKQWMRILNQTVTMDQQAFDQLCTNAHRYALEYQNKSGSVPQYEELFTA